MISIVVPVYNSEKYIGKCIESILNQTYKKWELILVDDGSKDNSLSICNYYAGLDDRIKVIHIDNNGSAHARNIGLSYVCGEYVAFIDSDDYIDSKYLEILLETLKKQNADIVECDYWYVENSNIEVIKPIKDSIRELSASDALYENVRDVICRQLVWNKLYKRDVIGNEKFVERKTIDDEFWTYRILARANKIIHISVPLYYYVQHSNSIMHKGYSIKRIQDIEAQYERYEFIKEYYPEHTQIAINTLFFSSLYHMQQALKYLDKTEIKQVYKELDNILKKVCSFKMLMSYVPIKQKIWVLLSKINFCFACKLRNKLRMGR